jgi:hypothetical protein
MECKVNNLFSGVYMYIYSNDCEVFNVSPPTSEEVEESAGVGNVHMCV